MSPDHPLFGTVDHVVPLSLGGTNELDNRRAAHRICNRKKAHYEVCNMDRSVLQRAIQSFLLAVGIKIGPKHLKKARRRAGMNPGTDYIREYGILRGISNWENEGGAVMQ
jgi:HNH endonuclease